MKTYKTNSGPFSEKPYYTSEEIEQICTEELQKVNLLPLNPEPIRIERFIEKRFKIHPTYDDLPEDVLGFTEFGLEGVKEIVISKQLSEEGSKISERRISTTMAHEVGHGLLHTHLFSSGQKPESLFGKDFDPYNPKILCRNDTIQGIQGFKGTGYCWWEYQANLAIGPLLLPRSLVMISLKPFLIKKGIFEAQILDRGRQEEGIRVLSETFDVNLIVAKIRIETLFPISQEGQLTL